jgi:Domain of unknown function (DUF932)
MRLVSKFDVRNVAKVGNLRDFLHEDTLRAMVPSIYAEHAHYSRSPRYLFIPTLDIVRGLEKEGFRPVFAAQAQPRKADKRGFTKHLIRFRREADLEVMRDEAPEIVCLNSHGGESRLQMFGGVIKGLCLNSNVWGDVYEDIKVRHTGRMVDDVVEGAFRLVAHFGEVMGTVDEWKSVTLSRSEQHVLAQAASVLRLGEPVEGQTQRVIDAEEFNTVRREGDAGPDLWSVHNRVQENVIRGGMEGFTRSPNGQRKRTTTRPVNSIDMDLRLNRALWTLSTEMAKLKA